MDDRSRATACSGSLGSMDPAAAIEALEQLGGISGIGVWRRRIGRAAARDALESGAVVRAARGQIALPGVDTARRAAAELGGVVSHLSAAQAHGWKIKTPPARPCVTIGRHAQRSLADVDVELRWGDLDAEDLTRGVTGPVRTVIDCARVLDLGVALSVADSALRSGLVTRDALLDAAHDSPRTGRRRAIRVAEEATELADNPFESVLRSICLDVPGLTVRPQGWIGSVGRIDLVDERLLIAIEADSWEFHSGRDAFNHDVRRYTELAARGWVVCRFTYEDVMRRPDWTAQRLIEVVVVRSALFARSPTSAVRRRTA